MIALSGLRPGHKAMLVNHRMLKKYSGCFVSNRMIQHENIHTKANIYSLEDNANNKKVRYFSFRF